MQVHDNFMQNALFQVGNYITKQLNPCPVSPASCVVTPCQLSACPGNMGPVKDHLGIRRCQTG